MSWQEAVKDVSKERAVEIVLEEGQKSVAKARSAGFHVGLVVGLILGLAVAMCLL